MRRLRPSLPVFLAGSALFLAPWSAWLASSLPCRYLSQHWGIAWAGFDTALAATLALTAVAALHHAPWLDRAAVAAATLLGADAWFDVVTSRGAAAVAIATTEAVAVELPVALLCIWVARRFATPATPWGAETRSLRRSEVVLVDEAAEQVATIQPVGPDGRYEEIARCIHREEYEQALALGCELGLRLDRRSVSERHRLAFAG